MTLPRSDKSERQKTTPRPEKRRYEAPKLVDYGLVSKLTQSGSITTRDNGNMFRSCL